MITRVIKILLKLLLLVVFAVSSFLFYIYIADYKPHKIEPLPISGKGITLSDTITHFSFLSWNIGYAGLDAQMDFFYDGGTRTRTTKEATERNLIEISKLLKEYASFDFVLLQEVDQRARRTYSIDEFKALSELYNAFDATFVKNYDVKYVPMPITNPMGRVIAGLATFSKYGAVESKRVSLPGAFSFPTSLFMLDRCFHLSRYTLAGQKQLVVINTHNTAFDDGSQRQEQIEELKQLAVNEFEKGNYVVIGGDFNTNPPSFNPKSINNTYVGFAIEPEIKWDFPQDWTFSFDGNIPSNRDLSTSYIPGMTKTTVIDFFILSPNIRVEEVKTIDLAFKHSDHQPVILNIVLIR